MGLKRVVGARRQPPPVFVFVFSHRAWQADAWRRQEGIRRRECATIGQLNMYALRGRQIRDTDRVVVLGVLPRPMQEQVASRMLNRQAPVEELPAWPLPQWTADGPPVPRGPVDLADTDEL